MQVHAGVREVGQAAGVVEVQVGEHDVAYVGRVVAEPGHLLERGLVLGQRGSGPAEEVRAQGVLGICDVHLADAGLDQDQAVVELQQQAVADRGQRLEYPGFGVVRLYRPHGAAVQVVGAHVLSSFLVASSQEGQEGQKVKKVRRSEGQEGQ